MKIPVYFVLAAALVLGGCGRSAFSGDSFPFASAGLRGAATEIDGQRFRTRIRADGDDRRNFVTATRGASRNLAAAAEAGRREAVRYCLSRYGGSEIAWLRGPDREIEEIALDESGALLLSGACIAR